MSSHANSASVYHRNCQPKHKPLPPRNTGEFKWDRERRHGNYLTWLFLFGPVIAFVIIQLLKH